MVIDSDLAHLLQARFNNWFALSHSFVQHLHRFTDRNEHEHATKDLRDLCNNLGLGKVTWAKIYGTVYPRQFGSPHPFVAKYNCSSPSDALTVPKSFCHHSTHHFFLQSRDKTPAFANCGPRDCELQSFNVM